MTPPRCSDASTSKVDPAWAPQHHLLAVSLPATLTKQQPWALAGYGLRSITQLSPPFPQSVGMSEQISRGTVTIAKSLRAGTFVFHLNDATAITGSWTCGKEPYSY